MPGKQRWVAIFAAIGAAPATLYIVLQPPRESKKVSAGLEWMLLHEAPDPNWSRPLPIERVAALV